jgi:hypothetical protein
MFHKHFGSARLHRVQRRQSAPGRSVPPDHRSVEQEAGFPGPADRELPPFDAEPHRGAVRRRVREEQDVPDGQDLGEAEKTLVQKRKVLVRTIQLKMILESSLI